MVSELQGTENHCGQQRGSGLEDGTSDIYSLTFNHTNIHLLPTASCLEIIPCEEKDHNNTNCNCKARQGQESLSDTDDATKTYAKARLIPLPLYRKTCLHENVAMPDCVQDQSPPTGTRRIMSVRFQ